MPLALPPEFCTGVRRIGVDACTGTLTHDFNDVIQGGSNPALVVGAVFFCQYWSRDPGSPSATSPSNALHGVVNP